MESDDEFVAASMLQLAVLSAITPEKAAGWFKDSGYFE
jgi:hypothetical protein